MSRFQSWCNDNSSQSRSEALRKWVDLRPTSQDWDEWYNSVPNTKLKTEDAVVFYELFNIDHSQWEAWLSSVISQDYFDITLFKMLSIDTPKGTFHRTFPAVTIEILHTLINATLKPYTGIDSILRNPPEYWFGSSAYVTSEYTGHLHQLAFKLLSHCSIEPQNLPSLLWSPKALIEDYGMYTPEQQLQTMSLQHGLEYAIHKYAVLRRQKVEYSELVEYFKKYQLDLNTFEVILSLSKEDLNLGSLIRTMHSVLSVQTSELNYSEHLSLS